MKTFIVERMYDMNGDICACEATNHKHRRGLLLLIYNIIVISSIWILSLLSLTYGFSYESFLRVDGNISL